MIKEEFYKCNLNLTRIYYLQVKTRLLSQLQEYIHILSYFKFNIKMVDEIQLQTTHRLCFHEHDESLQYPKESQSSHVLYVTKIHITPREHAAIDLKQRKLFVIINS